MNIETHFPLDIKQFSIHKIKTPNISLNHNLKCILALFYS